MRRDIGRPATPEAVALERAKLLPASSVDAHEAASDPHPAYLKQAEADALYDAVGTAAAARAAHVGDYHDAPAAPAAETLAGSPHAYQNNGVRPKFVIVQGGTVTSVDLSHNGSAWVDAGATAGGFVVATTHYLRVTYAVAPTVTVFEF